MTRNNEYKSGIYRVRRSLFGGCILQEWQNYPNTTLQEWRDVDYCHGPTQLKKVEVSP